eukprot:TRINITY_DN5685_c0_g1_i1.p1 TRINITY_DN5685_c0_g1~~TRINITY_DN5685_c0_g1_i1.p1  ORF type:complete len:435 (+),score=132.35 TRINITY_DN5685_c0_g1_i1:164-1468(+)
MATIKRGGKVSQRLLEENIISGFLYKEGALNKKWRNRFFILSKDFRFYWSKKKEEGGPILGSLSGLNHYKIVKSESFSNWEFKLSPKDNIGRTFHLKANNEKDRNDWIESLTAAAYQNGNENNNGSPILNDEDLQNKGCIKSEELNDPPLDFCDAKLGSELALVPRLWNKKIVGLRKVVGLKDESQFYDIVTKFSPLRNDGISNVYGFSIVDDTESLVMDYPAGRPLSQFTMHNPVRILDICINISNAMNYLHGNSVAHGNLRPNNIFVNEVRKQIVSVVIHEVVLSSLPVTSIHDPRNDIYYPPEKQNGSELILPSVKMDVFAFGMIMWEMFARNPAWMSEDMLPTESISQKLVDGIRPQLPENCFLSELIESCWDNNPEIRPSFQDICSTLDQINHLEKFITMRESIERTMSVRGSFQHSPLFPRKDPKSVE